MPARAPHSFSSPIVSGGIANRFEAALERTGPLLGGKQGKGIEHPVLRPIVIVEREFKFFVVHMSFASLSLSELRDYIIERHLTPKP